MGMGRTAILAILVLLVFIVGAGADQRSPGDSFRVFRVFR
jgi:hypothetical protein